VALVNRCTTHEEPSLEAKFTAFAKVGLLAGTGDWFNLALKLTPGSRSRQHNLKEKVDCYKALHCLQFHSSQPAGYCLSQAFCSLGLSRRDRSPPSPVILKKVNVKRF